MTTMTDTGSRAQQVLPTMQADTHATTLLVLSPVEVQLPVWHLTCRECQFA